MIDFESLPYAEWLEEANKTLVEINPDSIFFGMIKDGEVVTSYYNVGDIERAQIIQELFILSIIDRSSTTIKEMIDNYLENGYQEDEDEEEGEEEECEDT